MMTSLGLASAPPDATEQEAAAPIAEPAAPQVPHWSQAAAQELIETVEAAGREGLDPADYGPSELRHALEQGEGPALDAAARATALALARDYALGRVTDRARVGWHIKRPPDELGDLEMRLDEAVRQGQIRTWLESLLPADPRYAALRDALAATPETDGAARDRLRANLERWRWMPRALGDSYIYVNVPSYRLDLVEGGATLSSYDVVVGAKKTPTPQIVAPAQRLVVNPWWNVPKSIVKSSKLRAGRKYRAAPDGRLRQPPGPNNALGKIKIDMDNAHAIYLHDTPFKTAFTRTDRALSHGCIRVKDIRQLATELLLHGQGDAAAFESALAGSKTRTIPLQRNLPVYLVYFTADVDQNGQIVTYGDPYGRDAAILAGLDGGMKITAS
ncbi:L,D-transpeptidase [Sphingomonas oleivorans]|uniref:L,D-transpeptidase n=2 Tax=Sphingomonas oleivorans TaxID=1735121 RepID=A0A2T5FYE5_9SPHN|nr:L,D-transpeptidase [Sphingomonas oleivorans]